MVRMQGHWECEPLTSVQESSVPASEVGSATTATGCSAVGVARALPKSGTAKSRPGKKSAWQEGVLPEFSSPARRAGDGGGAMG